MHILAKLIAFVVLKQKMTSSTPDRVLRAASSSTISDDGKMEVAQLNNQPSNSATVVSISHNQARVKLRNNTACKMTGRAHEGRNKHVIQPLSLLYYVLYNGT